jgi:hypothetical protein
LLIKIIIQYTDYIKKDLEYSNGYLNYPKFEDCIFDEYLNSTYGTVRIDGFEFLPSDVLKLDPEAYKESYLAWKLI